MPERPNTAVSSLASTPPQDPPDLILLWIMPQSPSPSFGVFSSFHFKLLFLFPLSFTALILQHIPVKGTGEIALKWFIIWLTFATCVRFCACECMRKRGEGSTERRGGTGDGWGAEACKFLVLISQLALNQGSKVGLAQHLWQDKHLFLCWQTPELSYYPQYVNLSKGLYTHE